MGIVKAQSGVESRPRGRGRSAVAIGDYRQNMREREGGGLGAGEGRRLLALQLDSSWQTPTWNGELPQTLRLAVRHEQEQI